MDPNQQGASSPDANAGGQVTEPAKAQAVTAPENSGRATINLNEAGNAAADSSADSGADSGQFQVPEKYAGRNYLKGVDSYDKVFDMLDNAQTLIGKKPYNLPNDNSSQEDWDKFYAAMGRPESADGYQWDVPEGIELNADFDSAMKQIFHESGVSQKTAQKIADGYHKVLPEISKKIIEAETAKSNAEFDALAKETFGDREDAVIKSAKAIIDSFSSQMDPKAAALLNSVDNKTLIGLAGLLDVIKSQHIDEDTLSEPGGNSTVKETSEQARERGRKLMATEAYTNTLHKDHKKTKAEVDAIYGRKDIK